MSRKIWFKRKLYGWGWYPASKEGWLVTTGYVLGIVFFAGTLDEYTSDREWYFTFLLPVTLLTISFIRIAYKYGESPRWQWGKRRDD